MSWCTSRMNIVVIVVLPMFVICSESLEEKSSAALFRDVFDFLEQKNDLGELIDLEDDEIRDGVLQIFREHGFDESDLMADGILGGIWNMVFSEDGKRTFAFANLAKQLSCYQGVRGGVHKTLRFAFDKYNDYGCYCGGGQSYGNPVDETDRCCLDHDNCYGRAMSDYRLGAGCATYTTQYEMNCNRRRRSTQCERRGPGAGRALCECDRAMAICVSRPRAIRRYRRNNKNVRTTRKCSVPGKRTSGASNIWELIKSCNFISSNRNAGRPRRPQRRGRRSYRGK